MVPHARVLSKQCAQFGHEHPATEGKREKQGGRERGHQRRSSTPISPGESGTTLQSFSRNSPCSLRSTQHILAPSSGAMSCRTFNRGTERFERKKKEKRCFVSQRTLLLLHQGRMPRKRAGAMCGTMCGKSKTCHCTMFR